MKPDDLPTAVYNTEQSRSIDQAIINQTSINSFELMQQAAQAVFRVIIKTFSQIKSLVVFCGSGNNAGDGYVLATIAKQHGFDVSVIAITAKDKLRADAHKAYMLAEKAQITIEPYTQQLLTADLIVDALLGTGINGELRPPFAEVINYINASNIPVCAIDVPSGLSTDTGMATPIAVEATITICILSLKQGLLTAMAKDHTGRLIFADLDITATDYLQPSSNRLDASNFTNIIHTRKHYSHKGTYGHLLISGGNHGMAGAVIMAAEAAICSGSGLVTVLTQPEHITALALRRPEIITATSIQEDTLITKQAIVLGPGLGKDSWALQLFKQIIAKAKAPLVIDADALTLLSDNLQILANYTGEIVLTPHPKEMSRILNISTNEINNNRFDAIKKLYTMLETIASKSKSIVIVLKGSGTIVYDGTEISICTAGNPGMATAGMGDVLSGVIGSLLATGITASIATKIAVLCHSQAADELATSQGYIGMLATEIIPIIRSQLNKIANNQY
jgi:NAD(P)H-hydrate epimerase